ncbi:MAG TPA: tetraacyldisaccharide 4'-kinase [bacterium]|nr:tetraacyldisaccharide 4'-kinase [bacterium]
MTGKTQAMNWHRLWQMTGWGWTCMPFSCLFESGVRLRRIWYQLGAGRIQRLPVPVISVGNLSVGGTGKTPLIQCLARHFLGQGFRVAVLSRGYKRKTRGVQVVSKGFGPLLAPKDSGDEPWMLAETLPGAVVIVGEKRIEAGRLAVNLGCELCLLDDGFQHLSLHRDIDLLLFDGERLWGNGRVLPGGPLREPLSAVKRAHALVITRWPKQGDPIKLLAFLEKRTRAPVFFARHKLLYWVSAKDSARVVLEEKAVVGFGGIGNPAAFYETLKTLPLDIRAFEEFPDHHWYDEKQIHQLIQRAEVLRAEALVTTEKDWARLSQVWNHRFPLYYLKIALDIDHQNRLFRIIQQGLEE